MPIHLYNPQLAKTIASSLLEIGAIKMSPETPFTWASGWKSPIYCDNRLSLSYPAIRTMVRDGLVAMIRDKFPKAEIIAGVATAGIPQGALVAEALGLPFIYIRSSSKSHGLENKIEGERKAGAQVVLVEDLVSTGGSSLQAADAVWQAGMNVMGMVSIFTYGFPIADDNFKAHDVELWHLSDYDTLIASMIESGSLDSGYAGTLAAWRSNPAQWNQ